MTVKTIDAETGQRIDELLRMAAAQLQRGDYFLAEDSARTAVALVRDHPTALAVKAHAQLGAGLLRSAGLSLHDLFISSPEMIDTRFDPSLLPPPARMREVLARAKAEAPRQADAFDLGLVQAYLGFQRCHGRRPRRDGRRGHQPDARQGAAWRVARAALSDHPGRSSALVRAPRVS
jgi:hypothetical protein